MLSVPNWRCGGLRKHKTKRKPDCYASRTGSSFEGLEGYLNVPLSPHLVGRNPRRFSAGEVQKDVKG
jgi:hypothetical protein